MNHELEQYINDHLAGSQGAIILIKDLIDRHEDTASKAFFRTLKSNIENDQEVLRNLLKRAEMSENATVQILGSLTARASRIKLLWEGFQPGELGMFEALEMLTLGIQGKRQLWNMLSDLIPWYPEWNDINFADLELSAINQRDAVEERRIEAGLDSLRDKKRRPAPLLK